MGYYISIKYYKYNQPDHKHLELKVIDALISYVGKNITNINRIVTFYISNVDGSTTNRRGFA